MSRPLITLKQKTARYQGLGTIQVRGRRIRVEARDDGYSYVTTDVRAIGQVLRNRGFIPAPGATATARATEGSKTNDPPNEPGPARKEDGSIPSGAALRNSRDASDPEPPARTSTSGDDATATTQATTAIALTVSGLTTQLNNGRHDGILDVMLKLEIAGANRASAIAAIRARIAFLAE